MKRTDDLKKHGICPKTGKILNPFGSKPEWAIRLAYKIQDQRSLNKAQEALL